MNIIISSLNNMRITGSDSGLDFAKLFIAKSLPYHEDISIKLSAEDQSFDILKLERQSYEKPEFLGYQLATFVAIPAGEYQVEVYSEGRLMGVLPGFILSETAAVVVPDSDPPAYVIGRKIINAPAPIVAQDMNSESITFFIPYDPDLQEKLIFIDFIPIDKEDLRQPDGSYASFLSDRAKVLGQNVTVPGLPGTWLMINWIPSYKATKTAGQLQFAISIIANSGEERAYTWQTEPSYLTVRPNIGLRTGSVLSLEEELIITDLIENVAELRHDVDAIDEFLGDNTDADPTNDRELVVGGGGAAEFMEG